MQLKIIKGEATVTLTKTEEKKLSDAANVLAGLARCGVESAGQAIESLEAVNKELDATVARK